MPITRSAPSHPAQRSGRRVVPTKSSSKISAQAVHREIRNPDWTREETLLALDVYLRFHGQARLPAARVDALRFIDRRNSAIVELSALLQLYAQQRGVVGADSLRNAHGVARKVNKFHAAALGRDPDSVRGARLEAEIWHEFLERWDALRSTAAALRAGIRLTAYASEDGADRPTPSRGPVPSFGAISVERADSSCIVYLLRLHGASAPMLASHRSDRDVLKIGRSNDIARRLTELHQGFPPTLRLRWQLLRAWRFPGAHAAHRAEQALLDEVTRRRWALGGEFAAVPRAALNALEAHPCLAAVLDHESGAPCSATEARLASRRR